MVNQSISVNHSYEAQVKLLKVLTHPARLAILALLRDGEHCVCHMEAYLGYRQAYISQQLMVMRDAGLIQDRRDGWNVYYRVTDARIFDVLAVVDQMANPLAADPIDLMAVNCQCPQCNKGYGE